MHFPWDEKCSGQAAHEAIARLHHQMQIVWSQPWFWKAVGATPYGKQIAQLAQDMLRVKGSAEKKFEYLKDLVAFKQALDRLSRLPIGGDAKVAGQAYGDVMVAASKFVSYLPVPLNAYSVALEELGKNLGNIAYMMTPSHRMDISGYSQHEKDLIMSGSATGH